MAGRSDAAADVASVVATMAVGLAAAVVDGLAVGVGVGVVVGVERVDKTAGKRNMGSRWSIIRTRRFGAQALTLLRRHKHQPQHQLLHQQLHALR